MSTSFGKVSFPLSGKNIGDHCARTDKSGSSEANQVNHTLNGDFSANNTAFANVILRTHRWGSGELVCVDLLS